jgi:Transport protein particle (TRAPP) component
MRICRLHSMGVSMGSKLVDLYVVRDKNCKRETKLLNMLLFIKTTVWKVLLFLIHPHCILFKPLIDCRICLGARRKNWSTPTTTSARTTSLRSRR